uniref:Putative abhydrolase domain-containing protein 2-like isoform x2 n=1 Tax=Panstrongylus lignarius TaxID=156445 RepID=A0A224XDK5_9HEMI
MTAALLAVIGILLWIILRVLNITTQPQKPKVYCQDSVFLAHLIKWVPSLKEDYIPTRLWGFNGHLQTIVHSIIGRVKCPLPIGERIEVLLSDGSTLTYDVYQPLGNLGKLKGDITIIIVPGICNTSESVYVRTFVHYAQYHGYRCAVLNHIGALTSVPLTACRIFTYGHTNDLNEMINNVTVRYPTTKFVCIGYSMGGNIVTKYLGEHDIQKPASIIGGVSICQGYDIIRGTKWLLQWQNFRRIYLYAMTEAMKSIILRHRNILMSEYVKKNHNINEKEVISAATLPELDDAYTRKVYNFKNLSEMYNWSSSINYLSGIQDPMIFINTTDDPLIHESLLPPIRQFANNHNKVAYIEVTHGGHLGFYEGGILYPNTTTWLDNTLIEIIESFVTLHSKKELLF